MYFSINNKAKLLKVEEDYASLKKISDNGDLQFEFSYKISQKDAVQKSATIVDVKISTKSIQKGSILDGVIGSEVDSRKLIKNILMQASAQKNANKQQEIDSVIATKKSDIISSVNNEILAKLSQKVSLTDIPQLSKSVLKSVNVGSIRNSTDAKPLLQFNSSATFTTSSIELNQTKLMHDLIVKKGIDPSNIISFDDKSTSSFNSVNGILKPKSVEEFDSSVESNLLSSYLYKQENLNKGPTTQFYDDSSVVQVLSSEVQDFVEVIVPITVPQKSAVDSGKSASNLLVTFSLIDSKNGTIIDSVTKDLNLSFHVNLFHTPMKPALVKASRSSSKNRANLEISQTDENAIGIKLYKKVFYRSTSEIEDYSLIGNFRLKKKDSSIKIPVDCYDNSPVIYRVLSYGQQGVIGHEYSNVVIKPTHYKPITSISLSSLMTSTGVVLEVRKIPQEVVAIEFLVRNLTTFQKEFTNVGSDIFVVDDQTRNSDFLTVIDKTVTRDNVYEYTCNLIYKSGIKIASGNVIVEFINPESAKVDTKISDVVVTQENGSDVTFSIKTNVIDTKLDVIKTLLEKQGSYDLFKNDVEKEKEFIKNLIAHNVQRVDLTSGIRENFGVITSESFSDFDLRKNQSIPGLKIGHKYRYEIIPLIRTVETMFDSLNKNVNDPVTKKPYSYSPSKFLHPVALTKGVLVSQAGLKTRFSKDDMSHGAIGSVTTVEVTLDKEPAKIVDASCSKLTKKTVNVTWTLQGSIDQIDHFLVFKEENGVRSILGKSHSEFEYGNCVFYHQLKSQDIGSYCYVIIPIFNDYTIGTETKTNLIEIQLQR